MFLMPRIHRFPGWLLLALVAVVLGSFHVAHAQDGLLEPEKAFRFDARLADPTHLELIYDIAPGHYMYREQFHFGSRGATLGKPELPAGHVKFDETFKREVETYRGRLLVELPLADGPPAGQVTVSVASQGCSDRGICYPPVQNHVRISPSSAPGAPVTVKVLAASPYMPGTEPGADDGMALSGASGGSSLLDRALAQSTAPTSTDVPVAASARVNVASAADAFGVTDRIGQALQSGQWWRVAGLFLVAGVLLSLTPCVLPMLPILSSIIVGEEARLHERDLLKKGFRGHAAAWRDRGRALMLAGSYSLGMAVIYTALGVAAGLAGEGLAAALQKPWVLGLFALALVGLSLSMFGVYELQLPASWSGRVASASNRLRGGRVAGVFVMGGLSALLVSPCVAAPLAGALVYISQTRDAQLGGLALFCLAVGMSVPLLLVGASAGALLPRAGSWMHGVKVFFGLLLLAVAIWIVQPVLPAPAGLALWGVLLLVVAFMLGALRKLPPLVTVPQRIRKFAATLVALYGIVQIVGATLGGTDPFAPLAHLTAGHSVSQAEGGALPVTMIRTSAELDQALAQAGRPVMLDFYADWCVSCKEMERDTYSDPRVREKLSHALVLKVDVTRNSPDDRVLLRRFNLFGPPGTLFFDPQGREVADERVIGFERPSRFLERLRAVGL